MQCRLKIRSCDLFQPQDEFNVLNIVLGAVDCWTANAYMYIGIVAFHDVCMQFIFSHQL
jgi:uncharacterized membrane protein YuzA (DUF378 family)